MNLENIDILELMDRYNFLIKKYGNLAIELAPKLEQFGKYKKELELITVELINRGATINNPDNLEKLINEELEKRGIELNGEKKTFKHRESK